MAIPSLASPWAPWGEGSDGTIAVEPRETSTALGFVMASGAICPRAGGDSHTFNNQYDRSEWMWALRQELDLEPPVVSTGTHFRGVGVGVARPLWAGRQLLWHLPQGHPLTHMGTQHFSPLGSVSSVRWIGSGKARGWLCGDLQAVRRAHKDLRVTRCSHVLRTETFPRAWDLQC